MNDEKRVGECPDPDACEFSKLEVDFAIPVLMTQEQQRKLLDLLNEITKCPWNQPVEGVHWVAGIGSKPSYSKADSLFLGKPVDPDAPDTGEPTYDDDVFFVETAARGFVTEKERRRVQAEREKGGDGVEDDG